MSTFPHAESLRLLSLDGGGIKGLTTLLILKRIFRTLREVGHLDEEPKPHDVFDLIAGTSTGGLIAIMLGRLHMSIDECITVYERLGQRVFGKKSPGGQVGRLVKGLISSALYDIGILQDCIKDVLRDKGYAVDVAFREEGPPQCKVMVCVTRKVTGKGDVLRTWETTHPTEENYDCVLWEAASATAAAPIYFKSVKFHKQGEKWYDGCLRSNNPIREIIAEAGREKSLKAKKIGCLLSVGTGVPKISSVSGNLALFLRGSVKMMMNSEEVADEFLTEELGKELNDSNRYFRFNVPQGMQDLEMDECNETEKMRGLTAAYLRKVGNGNEVERCAQSLLTPDINIKNKTKQVISMLPYFPCINFGERTLYSRKLREFFEGRSGGQQNFVLWGLGGSGKTQIALSFAHSVKLQLSVFWVRAETYSSFIIDFCQILKLVNPDEPPLIDQGAMIEKTRAFLESSYQDWLLVLDNADHYDDFVKDSGSEQSIARFVPRNGRILITTRDPRFLGSFAAAGNGLQVKTMNPNEARNLLINSLPRHLTVSLVESDVQKLLEMLGNLPLGIAQAAANIDDLQQTFAEYVRAYEDKQNRMELMQLPFQDFQTSDPHTLSQSIFITWEMSFERLQETAPLSATLINYMGIFHWRRVPKDLIMRLPEFESLSPFKLQGVVKRLLHLSMIDAIESEQGWVEYDIHPLMHERIFQRLSTKDAEGYVESVTNILASIFPVISSDKVANKTDDAVPIGRYFLPHALRLIDLIQSLTIRSKACARLLQTVGYFLSHSERPYLGSIVSVRALEMAPYVYDVNDVSVHYIRKFAIRSLKENAQYAEVEEQCRHALNTLDSPEFQSQHDEASMLGERRAIMDLRIEALRGLNKYAEAEEAYIARDRTTQLLLEGSDEVQEFDFLWGRAVQMHNIANVIRWQNRLDEAISLNQESLKMAESMRQTATAQDLTRTERAYMAMLNLKAHLKGQSLLGPAVTDQYSRDGRVECQNIYLLVFQKCFDLFGVTDIDTWKAVNNSVSTMLQSKHYGAAMNVLLQIGLAAKVTDMTFEGQLLEIFGITVTYVESLPSILRIMRSANLSKRATILTELFNFLVESKAVEFYTRYRGSVALNNDAVGFINTGRFRQAEQALRELLSRLPPESLQIAYYNLMLAIARQPGRQAEAFVLREKYLEKISAAEEKHGHLSLRLQRDEEDFQIYQEAKTKIEHQQMSFGDAWWTEHEKTLERAELRYGVLFQDVFYDEIESDLVIEDIDQETPDQEDPCVTFDKL